MPGFQSPNYTQCPNDLFDKLLPELSNAELRVIMALVRYTFGFHQDRVRLSIRLLSKRCGISPKSVWAASERLVSMGLITHSVVDGVTEWVLVIEEGCFHPSKISAIPPSMGVYPSNTPNTRKCLP